MLKPKTYDFCVFCEKHAEMHGEHMFDNWMGNHIPRTLNAHKALYVEVDETGMRRLVRRLHGDPAHRKIRCVCKCCNTGWMSQATVAAKPTVLAMIKGSEFRLSETDQYHLRRWIAIKAVTSEYSDFDNITISAEDRAYIFKHGDSPPDWKIWIGNIQTPLHTTMYAHHQFVIDPDGPVLNKHTYRNKYNTHAGTYAVEKMFIHVITCSHAGIFHDWRMPERISPRLRCISPLSGLGIVWPAPPLCPVELDIAMNAFRFFVSKTVERVHGVKLPNFN